VGFREVVETSTQMCIVLDYASGGELFEFVAKKRSQATEQDIQYIFAQIVDGKQHLAMCMLLQSYELKPFLIRFTDSLLHLALLLDVHGTQLSTTCTKTTLSTET
jgi:serine/threonine protein kinase